MRDLSVVMKPFLLRFLLLGLLALWLAACSRLDTPEPGDYRAVLNLRGGELPVQLKVTPASGTAPVRLSLIVGDQTFNSAEIKAVDGRLTVRWDDLGTLSGKFTADNLQGELRVAGADGKPVALPFAARRDQSYRFIEKSASDNADISGSWQLEALSEDHFNVPVIMQLHQQHDQVDGDVHLPNGVTIGVIGQTHGDAVSLGLVGHGRAVLLKGKVDAHGELKGEFWVNLGSAHPWIARVDHHGSAADNVANRQVGMPWAVPVRDIAPTIPNQP